MDDDDIQWQEEFKVRVSSDFDRLVAFATEMNKSNNSEVAAKREMDLKPQVPMGGYMRNEETMQMKTESFHDFPTDLSKEKRYRMMMENQMKSRQRDQRD